MDNIAFGAIAPLKIAEWQTIADLAGAPIAPAEPDGLGCDRVQLTFESGGAKEFHRVGTDVDAGTELRQFGRLLVDLDVEAALASAMAAANPPSPAPTTAIRCALPISSSHEAIIDAEARSGHPCSCGNGAESPVAVVQ